MKRRKSRILVLSRDEPVLAALGAALETDHHLVEVDGVGPLRPLLEREPGLVVVDAELSTDVLAAAAAILALFEDVPLLVLETGAADPTWEGLSGNTAGVVFQLRRCIVRLPEEVEHVIVVRPSNP